MKKVLIVLVALLGGILLLSPLTAQAQSVQEARCTVGKARIDTRKTRVEAASTAQTTVYDGIAERLGVISEGAALVSFDSTALSAAIELYNDSVTAYQTANTEYITSLTTLAEKACAETAAEFTTALADSRTKLTTARAASLQVRATYTNEVKPALQAYVEYRATLSEQPTNGEEQ